MIKLKKIEKALNNPVNYTRDWHKNLFLHYKEPYPCFAVPNNCINVGAIYLVLENKEFHFGFFCDECAEKWVEWVKKPRRVLTKLDEEDIAKVRFLIQIGDKQ